MPWKRESPMDQKVRLIGDWLSGGYSRSALSRYYGVSRPTVDKWIGRYEAQGLAGLSEQPRTPKSHPNQTSDWVEEALIEAKGRHQDWGPKKLVWMLQRERPEVVWPAPSTAGEILKRAGLVRARRPRRVTPPWQAPFRGCEAPNQVWSVDYKGQFRTGDQQWCYPLTLTDNATRYLLTCRGLRCPTLQQTRPWLESAFREYGLPKAIRSDNGSPFASTGLAGLSTLSVWWIKLGIVPERIQPGRPDQNGRHERMHRSLKAGALRPPSATIRQQQAVFRRFQKTFNEERPHESLGMQTPDSLYRPSPRRYPERLPDIEYSLEHPVRRVRHNGEIKWRGERIYTSQILSGEPVELREAAEGGWVLYFHTYLLGYLKPGAQRIEPQKL